MNGLFAEVEEDSRYNTMIYDSKMNLVWPQFLSLKDENVYQHVNQTLMHMLVESSFSIQVEIIQNRTNMLFCR